jgi:hypothetical protein
MLKKIKEFAQSFLTLHIAIQYIFGTYYIYSMLFNISHILTWLITTITVILQWYAVGCYLEEDK